MPVTITTWRQLQAMADAAEPRVRRAILRAMATLRSQLTDAQIASGVIPPQVFSRSFRQVQQMLTTLAIEAARFNIQRYLRPGSPLLSVGVTIPGVKRLSFSIVNPAAVEAATTREVAKLIKAVGKEVKQGVRLATKRGMVNGIPVRSTARMIRDQVGLGPWQVRALARQRDDLIRRGYAGDRLERAMAQRTKKALVYRSQNIARTENLRAVSIGQDKVWADMQARRNASPGRKVTYWRKWIITPDSRLCPVCEPLGGVKKKIGQMFVSKGRSVPYPPLHPSCRCALGLVVP